MNHDVVPHIQWRGPLRYLVCGPLGAAANLFDPRRDPSEAQACADRGQHELDTVVDKVNDRLQQAHGTGQLAIAFGIPILKRKVAQKVAESRSQPSPNMETSGAETSGADARSPDTRAGDFPTPQAVNERVSTSGVDRPPSAAGASEPDDPAAVHSSALPAVAAPVSADPLKAAVSADLLTAPVSADALAIPGYDTLSASQVVECLPGLGAQARALVRAYEAANRGRRTILGKLDQLQATG